MDEKINICEACMDLCIEDNDREHVLKLLTGLLVKHGYVDEGYIDKILEREKDFPTGLRFEDIAIALPHGDSSYVKKSAVAIGRCRQNPLFHSMEEPDRDIPVDIIVLLAVKNPEKHLTVLNNLLELFSSREKCQAVLNADEKKLCELFENTLYIK